MKIARSIITKITLAMVIGIIFTGTAGFCNQGITQRYLTIPYTGTVRIPADLEFVQYKITAEMLDKQQAKQEELLKQQAGIVAQRIKGKSDTDMEFYQLVMNDGDSYHTAMLVFAHDRDKMVKKNADFFGKLLTNEQKQELNSLATSPDRLEEFNRGFQEGFGKRQHSSKNNPENVRIKIIGIGPLNFPVMNNKQIYSGGLRLLMSSDNAILPVYFYGYNLPSENCAFAGLACMDSEREFWSAFMENLLVTFTAVQR